MNDTDNSNLETMFDELYERLGAESSDEVSSSPNTEIPVNVTSYDINENNLRFRGAPWFDVIHTKDILLAGLGGIGSFLAMFLARMNPRSITLYDDDVIEKVNLAGQFYCLEDVGQYKVNNINFKLQTYSNYYSTISMREKFDTSSSPSKIMICGFDNMLSRQVFFEKWVDGLNKCDNKHEFLYIDGRMSAETIQIFCIRGNNKYDINRYRTHFLFDSSEAEVAPCSYKQTTYCAGMIGGMICNLLANFCTNEAAGTTGMLRDLPFYTEYNAEFMYFKTES